jgi:hypothetical protein
VFRAGNPTDVVLIVKVSPGLRILFGDQLHAVVIYEDVGAAPCISYVEMAALIDLMVGSMTEYRPSLYTGH